jgi:hypothetical protein
VTNVNVGGTAWNLYIGTVGSQKTFSFVAANGPLTNWSGDIKAFWTYLAQHQGYPQSSQYLLNTYRFISSCALAAEATIADAIHRSIPIWDGGFHWWLDSVHGLQLVSQRQLNPAAKWE